MKTAVFPILVLLVLPALAAVPPSEPRAADGRPNEAAAQEPAKPEESRWQAYFRHIAAAYTITAGGQPTRRLALHKQPIMKWSQPVRGGDDGAYCGSIVEYLREPPAVQTRDGTGKENG